MAFNSSFSPSSLVDWLHERPRFGRTNDITTVHGTGSSDEYWEGVGALTGVFFVVAILSFLLFLMLYCCACCRCCCFKKKKEQFTLDAKTAEQHSNRTRRKLVFLVLTVLLVCTSAVSAYFVSELVSGTSTTTDGVTGTLDIVDSIDAHNNDIITALEAAQVSATSLDTTLGGSSESQALLQGIADALVETSSLSDTTGNVNSDLDDARDDSDEAEDRAKLVGWVYVAIVAVWALLVLVSITMCKRCMFFFKLLMWVALLVVVLTWVFTGVMFSAAMVSADVCIDPDNIVVDLTDASPTAEDTSAEASIFYYVYCDTNTLTPVGLTSVVDDTQTEVDNVQADLAAIPSNPSTDADIAAIDTELTNIQSSLDAIADDVSCSSINAKYRVVRDGLCTDTVDPLISLWAIQLVASVLLILSILVALPFWNHKHVSAEERQASALGPVNSSPMPPQTGADVRYT